HVVGARLGGAHRVGGGAKNEKNRDAFGLELLQRGGELDDAGQMRAVGAGGLRAWTRGGPLASIACKVAEEGRLAQSLGEKACSNACRCCCYALPPRRSRPPRRPTILAAPSRWWCRSRPAAAPTCSAASSPSVWPSNGARRWWSKISPAPPAASAPEPSPKRSRTATRCWWPRPAR